MHGWFEAPRAEHHDDGIRVTMVSPGYVRTAISLNALTGDGTPQGTMDNATDNGISPERCARVILRGTDRNQRSSRLAKKKCWATGSPGLLRICFGASYAAPAVT